jgi:DNA-binding beta-propeller fold protein YncE
MVLTPDGKTLFVANNGDNTVSSYAVASDAKLTAQGSPAPVGSLPVAVAVDPSSTFLFVANQGTFGNNTSGTISVFMIQGSSLTEVTGSPFVTEGPNDAVGTGPSALVASPTGSFLYVANQFTNDLSVFSYDNTGALTLLTGCGAGQNCPFPRVAAGSNPSALAFSRCAGVSTATSACATNDGNNLFIANSGSNNISVFAACIQPTATCTGADGSLIPIASSPFAAGSRPIAFMVHPLLNFVYAVDSKSNQVSQFKYSPATGALSALSPAAVSASSNPLAGGITSDGNWAFVPNNGGSSVSAFKVGVAGRLDPATTSSIALGGRPSVVVVR